jgi:hypothetical protein
MRRRIVGPHHLITPISVVEWTYPTNSLLPLSLPCHPTRVPASGFAEPQNPFQ